MKEFQPDLIVALGGGSVMDAAKGMWIYYENPDLKETFGYLFRLIRFRNCAKKPFFAVFLPPAERQVKYRAPL